MTAKEEEYTRGFDLWKYNKTLSSHVVVCAENVKIHQHKKVSNKMILSKNVQRSNIMTPAIVGVPDTGSLLIMNTS